MKLKVARVRKQTLIMIKIDTIVVRRKAGGMKKEVITIFIKV